MDISPHSLQSQALPPSTHLRIMTFDANNDLLWNGLVSASPQGSVFLRSDWLDMLRSTDKRGLDFLRIGYFDAKQRLVGGWALPYRKLGGLRYAAVGFEFFYAGPLLLPELSCPTMHYSKERHTVLSELAQMMRQETDFAVAETHPSLQDVRDFLYQNWTISPEYTHIWDMLEPDAILARMNREKRREIKRGMEAYQFAHEELHMQNFEEFIVIYQKTMRKFGWYPSSNWRDSLYQRLEWMCSQDGCRLYTARTPSGALAAAVLVLLSREDQTVYLWRMAHDSDLRDSRIVPALYWWSSLAISQHEPNLRYVNFGGSPLPSLGQFKDYLGAQPIQHFRLIHRRPSVRLGLWRGVDQARDLGRKILAQYPWLDRIRIKAGGF